MVFQLVGRIESHIATQTVVTKKSTNERLYTVMIFRNMGLQSSMLAERAIAIYHRASELLTTRMGGFVSLQPCGIEKAFVTVWPGTRIISLTRMGRFYMVIEVRNSSVTFGAGCMGTSVRTSVCM